VHLWAYRDLAERAERRGQLVADEGWQSYVQRIRPLILTQENKLLTPARFSPPLEAFE
jgi:hypothetical protein